MMIRYIPDFILRQYEKQQLAGSFDGYALLFDIADFTHIGTEFQKHGKEGVEELSKFLGFVFGEPIRIVKACGGFISLFAGDAFCAIFPDREKQDKGAGGGIKIEPILAAVQSIRDFFKELSSYHSSLGEFPLQVRQTVSYGEIHWQIFENELQNEYVFFGKPMRDMAELSALKEDLVFSATAVEKLGQEVFERRENIGFVFSDEDQNPHASLAEHSVAPSLVGGSSSVYTFTHQLLPYISGRFLNPKYHDAQPEPEFRSAAFCFANLDEVEQDNRVQAIAQIQHLADKFGGFVNKYDDTDKGLTALILFGLPRSEGKTLGRLCSFALEAIDAIPCLALGISCGSVFSGFTGNKEIKEYTALGAPVNLAARLMSKARAGEVLADNTLWQELHSVYDFGYLGSLSLKGIEQANRYYRLKRLAQQSQREEHRFVGRDEELRQIHDYVNKAIENRENILLYVNGDAGIGKSRLVSEALASYSIPNPGPAKSCYKFFITCDAILHKPLEAIKQILRSHFYYNPALPIETATPMFRVLWNQIDPTDIEMQRIESFLASLLGFEWENSIWSMLPPEERRKQLKSAFVYFIRKLSQSKPILIHLDDGQWLDDESQSYFQALSESEISPVIFISPCRYLEDGSKAELHLIKHRRIDLDLDYLSEESSSILISSILRLRKVPPKTQELIYGRSMGNPLFLEQLSSYLLDTSSINDKGKLVKELGDINTFTIRDIIGGRIDCLKFRSRDCVYNASILGMRFNVQVLSHMLNNILDNQLEVLKSKRIWKEIDKLRFVFCHILIKDVVYNRMISDKVRGLHKLAAETLELIYYDVLDERAEEIGHHYEKADLRAQAADYYDKAGLWYQQNCCFRDSRRCFLTSLSIRIRHIGKYTMGTANTLNHLARLYHDTSHFKYAETLYIEAATIIARLRGEQHTSYAYVIANLGNLFFDMHQYDESLSYSKISLSIFEDQFGYNDSHCASSLMSIANVYCATNNVEHAIRIYDKIYRIYSDNPEVDAYETLSVLGNIAAASTKLGKYDIAENLYNKVLDGYDHIGLPAKLRVISTLNNLAIVYTLKGNYPKARSFYLLCLEMQIEYLGFHSLDVATTLAYFGKLCLLLKDTKEAEKSFLSALASLSQTLAVPTNYVTRALQDLIDMYNDMDEHEKAAYYRAMLPQEEKTPE
ncbi:MAG: tetratricopeptide repeat protein [Candidatus Izemoplasmatales bacterium]|jgi:class 3 adenylate cyclase/tetratricopeptide (TPR) repeat protein